MEQPEPPGAPGVTPEGLQRSLENLRDCAVRLSLALEDYQFYMESNRRPEIAQVTRECISRIQALRLK